MKKVLIIINFIDVTLDNISRNRSILEAVFQRRLTTFFAITLLIFFLLPISIYSNPPVDLTDNQGIHYLPEHLDYFIDNSSNLNFNEIRDIYQKGNFIENREKYLAFGFTKAAVWCHLKVIRQHTTDENHWYLYLEYSMIDEIEVFIPDISGKYKKIDSGNHLTFKKRPFAHRQVVIPVNLENKSEDLFFKIKTSDDSLEIPAYLVSTQGLIKKTETESAIHSAYFGIIFIIIIYFISIYVAVREKVYLFYILYALSMLVTQAAIHGFVFRYLTPENYFYSQVIRNAGATSAMVFAILFAIEFLNLKKNFPVFSRILYVLIGISIFLFVLRYILGIFDHKTYGLYFYILLTIFIISGFISGLISFRIYIYARYYLLAWTLFMAAAIIFALRFFNIYTHYFTLYCLELGDAVQISILSLALARRIRIEKEQSEQAEKTARENHLEILKIRNDVLEKNLEFARILQMRLIPDLTKEKKMSSLYMPMEKVGGDFFDIIELDKKNLGIFFADVTGHGVPAAFITAIMKSALSIGWKNHSKEDSDWLRDPATAFIRINEIFLEYCQNHFISAIYGVYNKETGIFNYVSGTHPPLMVIRRNVEKGETSLSFQKISPQAPLIGIMGKDELLKDKITVGSITIPPDAWLLFYSDGLMDGIQYSYLNFDQGLESFRDTPLYSSFKSAYSFTPDEFINEIKVKLLKHLNTQSPDDDICLLLLER